MNEHMWSVAAPSRNRVYAEDERFAPCRLTSSHQPPGNQGCRLHATLESPCRYAANLQTAVVCRLAYARRKCPCSNKLDYHTFLRSGLCYKSRMKIGCGRPSPHVVLNHEAW